MINNYLTVQELFRTTFYEVVNKREIEGYCKFNKRVRESIDWAGDIKYTIAFHVTHRNNDDYMVEPIVVVEKVNLSENYCKVIETMHNLKRPFVPDQEKGLKAILSFLLQFYYYADLKEEYGKIQVFFSEYEPDGGTESENEVYTIKELYKISLEGLNNGELRNRLYKIDKFWWTKEFSNRF